MKQDTENETESSIYVFHLQI